MLARDCMTPITWTLRPHARIHSAHAMMSKYSLQGIPIADDEMHYLGIVTRTAVRSLLTDAGEQAGQRSVLGLTMNCFPTVTGDTPVESVWEQFANRPGLGIIPVVTDGKLEGTISSRNLLRAMAGMPREDSTATSRDNSLPERIAPFSFLSIPGGGRELLGRGMSFARFQEATPML